LPGTRGFGGCLGFFFSRLLRCVPLGILDLQMMGALSDRWAPHDA
jgi:hypothetical protein